MIEFECQHCGKVLHLNDSYAGRDGWCRVCKRMVVVPDGGPPVRIEDLPPEEGYARLQRLLQYAATKADLYKIQQARKVQEDEKLSRLETALKETQRALEASESGALRLRAECELSNETLEAYETRIAELEEALQDAGDLDSAGVSALEAAVAGEAAARKALLSEQEILASEQAAREALATQLEGRTLEHSALQAEIETLREEHATLLKVEEERRVALERELADCNVQLAQATAARDQMARMLEEGVATGDDSTRVLLEKDREISGLQADIARLKQQQDDTNRATCDQIRALEEQVALLHDIKGRLGILQEKLKDTEQERMFVVAALDDSRNDHELAQKKLENLEGAMRQSAEEKADQASQLEQLHRELTGRDEQIHALEVALERLTARHAAAVLAAETSVQETRSAESRAVRATEELQGVQARLDALLSESDSAQRSRSELEAALSATRQELEDAHQAIVLEKEAANRTLLELGGTVSALEAALDESREQALLEKEQLVETINRLESALKETRQVSDGESDRRDRMVAELQAEVMNLTDALDKANAAAAVAHEKLSDDQQRLTTDAMARAAALAVAEARVTELEAQLERHQETVALHQVEEESLLQTLSELRTEYDALKERLAAAEAIAETGAVPSSDSDVDDAEVIVLESDTTSPTGTAKADGFTRGAGGSDGLDERRRHIEHQEMMDALSDFLNK